MFALKWEDFQVQTNRLADPGDIASSIETTQNAEEASARGLELEFLALAAETLTLGLNIGYTNSESSLYGSAGILRKSTLGIPRSGRATYWHALPVAPLDAVLDPLHSW